MRQAISCSLTNRRSFLAPLLLQNGLRIVWTIIGEWMSSFTYFLLVIGSQYIQFCHIRIIWTDGTAQGTPDLIGHELNRSNRIQSGRSLAFDICKGSWYLRVVDWWTPICCVEPRTRRFKMLKKLIILDAGSVYFQLFNYYFNAKLIDRPPSAVFW